MTAVDDARAYMLVTEDMRRISEHLFLDQQTVMPPAAIDDRSRQLAWLEGAMRDRLASDEFAELLDRVEAEGEAPAWLAAARRDLERERKRPTELQQAFASVGLQAVAAWNRARAESDWSAFAPWLQRMVDINLAVAEAVGYETAPHDALLSLYEPGPTAAEIDAIFASLRDDLTRLAREREVVEPTPSPVVPRELLLELGADIGRLLGFDFERGTLAISPHGYTNPGGPNDIRVTFRDDRPVAETVGTLLHEYGHGLYEQGIAPELWGTAGGRGIMPYIHESQSKFWENIVGRRRQLMPTLSRIVRDRVGALPGTGPDELYAIQTQAPASMIRTESDEVSFNLHIFLRWEVERGLLSGALAVDDVPELWRERSIEYFGRPPVDDREGALQDPHWCRRYFGLFTSYVVGNIGSAQMAAAMRREGIDLDAAATAGELAEPLAWLRRHIHAPGRTLTLHEILERATGSRLDPGPYRQHLLSRYARTTHDTATD